MSLLIWYLLFPFCSAYRCGSFFISVYFCRLRILPLANFSSFVNFWHDDTDMAHWPVTRGERHHGERRYMRHISIDHSNHVPYIALSTLIQDFVYKQNSTKNCWAAVPEHNNQLGGRSFVFLKIIYYYIGTILSRYS